MKPSRIIKSAYMQAGFQGSLKTYVREVLDGAIAKGNVRLVRACATWVDNKTKQRKSSPSQRANAGHHDVHRIAEVRSRRHSNAVTYYAPAPEVK